MVNDTITAIATPPGSGGIGVIRISGPTARDTGLALFRRARENGETTGFVPESHRLYHGYVRNPDGGEILDEVLFVWMQAPRSYTREDVVEIHVHAGPAVLRSVLDLVRRKGARLAEPGEFTRRAFLNGRIDLTQAEGVMDLINARTDRSLTAAAAQVQGEIKAAVETSREALLTIQAEMEAAIDFPEDVDEAAIDMNAILDRLRDLVIAPVEALLARHDQGRIVREGLRVVVAGRPNVGKSSLMNRLLRQERAIVTPVPGTTRDLIDEAISLEGIPVILTDTAGLRKTEDPVERIGVERAYERVRNADIVLFLTDASSPLTPEDKEIYDDVRQRPVIHVRNKWDQVETGPEPDVPADWQRIPEVRISALYDMGIDTLQEVIAETVLADSLAAESTAVPNLRHKMALERALDAVVAAAEGLKNDIPPELVGIDLQEAMDALGEVTGVTIREDILDQIFSRFCIGK